MSLPTLSIPLFIILTQPSVVIIWKRVENAFIVSSKLALALIHLPFWSKQSYFVATRSILSAPSHLQRAPLKQFTPMMENTNMKSEATSNTFVIDGNDAVRAITTSFIPSSFEITLKGRKALRALKAFKDQNPVRSIFVIKNTKSIAEQITTRKSSQFQEFLIYGLTGPKLFLMKPFANILIIASNKKMNVNKISIYPITITN